EVARAYVLYREKRAQLRAQNAQARPERSITVIDNGQSRPPDTAALRATIVEASSGLEASIDVDAILNETIKNLYDGMPVDEVYKSLILASRTLVEKHPDYSHVTAGLLLHNIRKEVQIGRASCRQKAYGG